MKKIIFIILFMTSSLAAMEMNWVLHARDGQKDSSQELESDLWPDLKLAALLSAPKTYGLRAKRQTIIHICESCSKEFPTVAALNQHIKERHAYKKKYRCFACGRSYTCKESLYSHRNRIHQSNDIQCEWCPHAFPTLQVLETHRKRSHEANEGEIPCNLCPSKFKSIHAKNIHRGKCHEVLTVKD